MPTVLTVTSTADSGPGTLRNEIAAAAAGDTIVFNMPKPSTINLASTISVSKSLSILGPGENALTVAGNNTFEIFLLNAVGAIMLSGMTIRGGSSTAGGGIECASHVGVSNCIVTNNTASFGGGIYNTGGNLSISGCVVSANTAQTGGGVFNTGGGTVAITSSTIAENLASQSGKEGDGGGITNYSFMTMIDTSVFGNKAGGSDTGTDGVGGGIYNAATGSLTVIDSTVSSNTALGGAGNGTTIGAGIGAGGGIASYGNLSVIRATIANNLAHGGTSDFVGGQAQGGGVFLYYSTAALTDCTIGGNQALGGDGGGDSGGDGTGGGTHAAGSTLSIVNCTIARNQATTPAGGMADGGGLFLTSPAQTSLENTILADNTAGLFPDYDSGGSTATANNNLAGSDGGGITNGQNGNITGVDPMLGPLANNGGPTQTMALLPGSPAIDKGSNSGLTFATDQRGLNRFANGITDIGAFEFQPIHLVAVGAGYGMAPEVKVYDASTGALKMDFLAYEPTFHGGVRVAVADINGDGTPDIITAPAGVRVSLVNVNGALVPSFDLSAGRAPEVKVFSGVDGSLLADFLAYDSSFKAGIFVAAASLDGSDKMGIITAPDATGQPGHTNVRVFFNTHVLGFVSGGALVPNREFNAYAPGFGGGVRIAAADLSRNGYEDIVTAPGIWSGPDVRVFDGKSLTSFASTVMDGEFLAYDSHYFGGVFVAAGDVNGDGIPDIVTGTNGNGGPEVKAFSGATALGKPSPTIISDFFAYNPAFNGGADVAVTFNDTAGRADIITGAGPGGGPHVRIFDGTTSTQLQQNAIDSFYAFDPGFTGGVYVGGA